jgi:hypothetical protein
MRWKLTLLVLTLLTTSLAYAQNNPLGKQGSVGGTKGNPTCAVNSGGHVAHVSCDAFNAKCNLGNGTCEVNRVVGTLVYLPVKIAVKNKAVARSATLPLKGATPRRRARKVRHTHAARSTRRVGE